MLYLQPEILSSPLGSSPAVLDGLPARRNWAGLLQRAELGRAAWKHRAGGRLEASSL